MCDAPIPHIRNARARGRTQYRVTGCLVLMLTGIAPAAAGSLDDITLQVIELDQSPQEFAHIISVPSATTESDSTPQSQSSNGATAISLDGVASTATNSAAADIFPDTLLLKEPPLPIGEPVLWQDNLPRLATEAPTQTSSPDFIPGVLVPDKTLSGALKDAIVAPRVPQPPALHDAIAAPVDKPLPH